MGDSRTAVVYLKSSHLLVDRIFVARLEFPALTWPVLDWYWWETSLLARTGEAGVKASSRGCGCSEIRPRMAWIEDTPIGWRNGRRGGGPQGNERAERKTLRIVLVQPPSCARGKETIWWDRKEFGRVGGVEVPWSRREVKTEREWDGGWNA
jgi:hypothetical protein